MAALRGISQNLHRYISHPNPNSSPAQLIFFRGIASKLFVKGISFSTTEETLAEAFSKFGEVIEANIIMDKVRNRSKGFGYVTFAKEDEAQKALMDMNGKLLDGRVVFVDNARPIRHFNHDMPIARGPPEPAADS
ncbi:small RNA-binding protein 11, chloroplastic-like isoform X1 [Alnus glutinosa]|uniref:small RNA-binding protein 11, chloroplastic-like isoform X1 n=1 Tax=Alnus glutinosa TaxID=3517 RepID=UPI002D77EE0A|nr:small RNA-binding protein 11, chloroplastic-like isoform X1 [Alnus glutinosa]